MHLNEADQKRAAIQKFMDTYGLNVASWSKRAGMSPNTLYGFMNGHRDDLTYGTLQRLARAVGVTVGTIMGEVALPETQPPGLNPREEEIIRRIRALGPTQQKLLSDMLKQMHPHPGRDHR